MVAFGSIATALVAHLVMYNSSNDFADLLIIASVGLTLHKIKLYPKYPRCCVEICVFAETMFSLAMFQILSVGIWKQIVRSINNAAQQSDSDYSDSIEDYIPGVLAVILFLVALYTTGKIRSIMKAALAIIFIALYTTGKMRLMIKAARQLSKGTRCQNRIKANQLICKPSVCNQGNQDRKSGKCAVSN